MSSAWCFNITCNFTNIHPSLTENWLIDVVFLPVFISVSRKANVLDPTKTTYTAVIYRNVRGT